jgi:hypothetical protein
MYPARQREPPSLAGAQSKRQLLNAYTISTDIDSMPYFAFQESTMHDIAG